MEETVRHEFTHAVALRMRQRADSVLLCRRHRFRHVGAARHEGPHRGAWRFRLYAADGALLHQAEVADNRYLLPPELVLTPGLRYRWELAWSDSQSDDKRETHSFRAVELTLAERAGRAGALRDAGSLQAARALAPELFTPEVRP